jgi:hypothetical protein
MPTMNRTTDKRRSKAYTQRRYDNLIPLFERLPAPAAPIGQIPQPRYPIGTQVQFQQWRSRYLPIQSGVIVDTDIFGDRDTYVVQVDGRKHTIRAYNVIRVLSGVVAA